MRFFRSSELAFWAAAVALLAALTAYAATRGHDAVPGGASTVALAAPAPASSQARGQVDALTALMPSGVAAGSNTAALASFAAAVTTQAQQGASIRKGEGAGASDPMLRGFDRAATDAARLTAHAGDPVASTALRTQVGLDVEHLNRLVLGLPAPDLPDTGLDPFNAPDALDPAQPGAPARPQMPALPGSATRPAPAPAPSLPGTANPQEQK